MYMIMFLLVCAYIYVIHIKCVCILLCLKTLFYALMFACFVSKTASELTRSSSVDVLHVRLRIYAFSTIVVSGSRIQIIVSGGKIKDRKLYSFFPVKLQ